MIHLKIQRQPDDTTCGPTSLHALYEYFGERISLKDVIAEVQYLANGGTMASLLACHALKKGYDATIYTYNLQVFDPTWFQTPGVDMIAKLKEEREYRKDNPRLVEAISAYIQFLELGGTIRYEDLTENLIRNYLEKNQPILCGVNVTYLYNAPRDYVDADNAMWQDDIRGDASGHFVIMRGFDAEGKIHIADPDIRHPYSEDNYYSVNISKMINSILLGVLTFDDNLLILTPKEEKK